jgi:hypothetical protein
MPGHLSRKLVYVQRKEFAEAEGGLIHIDQWSRCSETFFIQKLKVIMIVLP